MQRMLVGLALFLTLVVGILAIVVHNLSQEVDSQRLRRPSTAGSRGGAGDAVDPAQLESLEGRIGDLGKELVRIRRDQDAQRDAIARLGAGRGREEIGDEGARVPDEGAGPGAYLVPPERQREPDGGFLVTDEDEEYFIAVQQRVERRRRIDSQTRNLMRRIERLAGGGEIQPLLPENREKVEKIIRRFVLGGDEIIGLYYREPPPEIEALPPEAKREAMVKERDDLALRAREALVPLLGEADAAAIAETTFRNPWGGRFGNRRSGRLGDR